jgi:signal transduction histidine kinase
LSGAAERMASENPRARATVLNVNDRMASRYLVTQMLRTSGFDVTEAPDGTSGLALAREAPDAIVLDVNLPDLSGYEVCRLLKAAPETQSIPVLLTSAARTASEHRVEGLEAGADAYLVQPFESSELSATVRALLRIRAAERDATRLAKELEQAVKIRDDFMSIASHELKTPLTSLQLQLDGIQRKLEKASANDGDAAITKKLTTAIRQTDRLAVLVDDLLAISAITQGRLALEPQDVDLEVIVREAVDALTADAARSGSELRVEIAGPVHVRADPVHLGRVVTNLVSNAIKYGSERPIDVVLTQNARGVRLLVRDHGIGVAPADRERIFGRFERAVSTGNYGGLGLGLFISRQIVEAHQGTIRIEPTDGAGSTFVVELPFDGLAGRG